MERYLGKDNGDGPLQTFYTPTEDDINVLLRKDQEKELLNFEAFLQNYFDLSNPIHQKLLREIYPNYFERRLDVIRESLTLQEKIAKLKLFGPQTKEDIFFIYAIINGDIEIPDTVVFNLDQGATPAGHFNRGFFNVKRWTAEAQKTRTGLGRDWNQGLFGPLATPGSRPPAGLPVGGFSGIYAPTGPGRYNTNNPPSGIAGQRKSLSVFNTGLA